MHDSATSIAAYTRLHDVLESHAVAPLAEVLGYEYPDSGSSFPYGWMERDYTRELVNAFNQHVSWLNRLAAWELVLANYSEDEAFALRYEFTALPLDFCLHFPYQFRQRLTFCSTQLCYTAAIVGS